MTHHGVDQKWLLVNCLPSERLLVGKWFHTAHLVFRKYLQGSKSLLQNGWNWNIYGFSARSRQDLWIILWSHYAEGTVQIGQWDPTFSPKSYFSEQQPFHWVCQEDCLLNLCCLQFAKTGCLSNRGQSHYINSNDKAYWTASWQSMVSFHFRLNSIVSVVLDGQPYWNRRGCDHRNIQCHYNVNHNASVTMTIN